MKASTRTYNQVAGTRNVCGSRDRVEHFDFKGTKAAVSAAWRRIKESQWPARRDRVKFIPKQEVAL
jgi:hypothetical protein